MNFEKKDYILISFMIIGLIIVYFILKKSVNEKMDKTDKYDMLYSQINSQFNQFKEKLDKNIDISGNVIKFPTNAKVCIGDSCMSYDGSRHIIDKKVTILSDSDAGLDIRKIKEPYTGSGNWNYIQFLNPTGVRTSWVGSNKAGGFDSGSA
jgi:hypothetical protein